MILYDADAPGPNPVTVRLFLLERGGLDFDVETRSSQLHGFARIPFDDSGRFVMPDHLVTLAKIEDTLYFQGGGSFFTVWNPQQLYAMQAGWEAAQAACRSFEKELGKSGGNK